MNKKNPLKEKIVKHIKENGAMSYPDYHQLALTDPQHGYYMNQNVFNKAGDFTTSPEISKLFCNMVGVWVAHFYETLDLPPTRPKTLVEFGAGTGILMENILNILRQLGYLQNLRVVIAEVSPFLTKLQQQRINQFFTEHQVLLSFEESEDRQRLYNKQAGISIEWFGSWMRFFGSESNPASNGHYVFVNNEFFDALPVHKFRYNRGRWQEIEIDIRAERKPEILLTSNTNLPKSSQVTDNTNFFHERVFVETLGHPDASSIRKILCPQFRFPHQDALTDGMEFEVSPMGGVNSTNGRQRHRIARQPHQRRCVVRGLRG